MLFCDSPRGGSVVAASQKLKIVVAMFALLLLVCTDLQSGRVDAFYIPGIIPVAHPKGSEFRMQVNGMHSLTNLLPQSYYGKSALRSSQDFADSKQRSPFCTPDGFTSKNIDKNMNSLGMLLSGERLQWSPYTFVMGQNEACQMAMCSMRSETKAMTQLQVDYLEWLIESNYRVYLLIDNLPAYDHSSSVEEGLCSRGDFASTVVSKKKSKNKKGATTPSPRGRRRKLNEMVSNTSLRGYSVGVTKDCNGHTLLNNHLHFVIKYHTLTESEALYYATEGETKNGVQQFRKSRRRRRKSAKVAADEKAKGKAAAAAENELEDDDSVYCDEDDLDDAYCNFFHEEDVDAANPKRRFAEMLNHKISAENRSLNIITDISVVPFSIDWTREVRKDQLAIDQCFDGAFDIETFDRSELPPLRVDSLVGKTIPWTFSVEWIDDPLSSWGTRWDSYFQTTEGMRRASVMWLSLFYTILVAFSLSSTVAIVLIRFVRSDLARYAAKFALSPEEMADAQEEEQGWKQVHGDVFRAPRHADMLLILLATGAQLSFLLFSVFFVGALGYLTAANRGGIATVSILFSVIGSAAGGFFVAYLSRRLFQRTSWKLVGEFALFLPGLLFGALFTSNFVYVVCGSSGALPAITIFSLVVLWLFVFVPLTVVGASIGFRVPVGKNPVKTNTIPRPMDPTRLPSFLEFYPVLAVSGIVPFTCVFIELRLLYAAWWEGAVFACFGFLFVTFVMWAVICAIISMVIVYHRICCENYLWWWLSFAAPSSLGLHFALYALLYFLTEISISSFAATFLYFLYSSIIIGIYVLSSGCIGTLATWCFLQKIFSLVKVD